MGRREKLWCHPLDLSREDVFHAVREVLAVVALAAKLKRSRQPTLGQELVFFADQLSKDLIAGLNGNHVGEPDDPNLGLVALLRYPLNPVNVEKLRMDRPLVKAELKLFNSLFCASSLHGILNKPRLRANGFPHYMPFGTQFHELMVGLHHF
jgi:hypothetical protein